MPRISISRLPILAMSLALAPLAHAPAAHAQAEPVMGSGIPPGTQSSSSAREVGFATTAPADAALVVVMQGASLPQGAWLSGADSTAIAAAIAAEGF